MKPRVHLYQSNVDLRGAEKAQRIYFAYNIHFTQSNFLQYLHRRSLRIRRPTSSKFCPTLPNLALSKEVSSLEPFFTTVPASTKSVVKTQPSLEVWSINSIFIQVIIQIPWPVVDVEDYQRRLGGM